MKTLIAKRHLIRQNLLSIVGFCLAFYFCYHLVGSERSYWRLYSLEQQIGQNESQLSELSDRKDELEQKVVMMRPETINPDMLEERVRATLGYHAADERVIISTQ